MIDYPFKGVYPILYMFYSADGGVDREAMRLQTERCVAAGAHGIAVLGNVTEVDKLTPAERTLVMEVVGEAIGGRVPYAVTVGEPDADGQKAFVRQAQAAGADWVILRPPPGRGHSEANLLRFFGSIADGCELPVAVQNNPVHLDSWLSNDGLLTLHRNHPNVTLLKGEGPAVVVQEVIEATEGKLAVFSGRGGLEYLTSLRSGCAGLIPAPDVLEVQVRIFELFERGDDAALAEAERLHRQVLPLIVFMSQSLAGMLCYGKRLIARRLGISEIHPRGEEMRPSAFGLAEVERLTADLPPLGGVQ